jgi:hypothetical protein
MIEYIPNFYGAEKRPSICKVFTADSGEDAHTAINVGNEAELDNLTPEIIYAHMNNCLQYVEAKIDSMQLIQLDESSNGEEWPVRGWSEVAWAQNEISLWWQHVYYKDYEERLTATLQAEDELYGAVHEAEHAQIDYLAAGGLETDSVFLSVSDVLGAEPRVIADILTSTKSLTDATKILLEGGN